MKEQNGAAMSIGRVSTFLDIYAQRDLEEGRYTESEIQEIVDHFVMKLRMVRFLRTPSYDELFSGDPTWVTEAIAGHVHRWKAHGHQDVLPVPAHPHQPGAGAGAQHDGAVEPPAPRRLQAFTAPKCPRKPAPSSMKATS